MDLHPRLNVFVGVNGSGKTALLEALKLGVIGAIGEMKEAVPQKTIGAGYSFDPKKDPRLMIFQRGELVQSDEVTLTLVGRLGVEDQAVSWSRGLKKVNVRFKNINIFDAIRPYFNRLYKSFQSNDDVELPIFAYYSTGRLFLENNDTKSEMNGKRISGYLNAATAKSSQYLFKKWFQKREQAQGQYEKHGVAFDFSSFERVKLLLAELIPGCKSIFYDDLRFKEIVFVLQDGQALPYSMLSDGTRNLVALVSDLALRCAVLNPWLGEKINHVKGIVLIDEVDLHLHPSWQRQVVPSLLKAFPNIQFFITTHSPMTLASLEPHISDPAPNVFILKKNKDATEIKVEVLENELIGTANHWLTDVFGLAEPRSIEAENAIAEAKKILSSASPQPEGIRVVSEKLMNFIQAHDLFWIRWNYFAQQHGIDL